MGRGLESGGVGGGSVPRGPFHKKAGWSRSAFSLQTRLQPGESPVLSSARGPPCRAAGEVVWEGRAGLDWNWPAVLAAKTLSKLTSQKAEGGAICPVTSGKPEPLKIKHNST